MLYRATPTTVTDPDGIEHATSDPIGWLFHEPPKGSVAELAPGTFAAPEHPIAETRLARLAGSVSPDGERLSWIARGNTDTLYFASAAYCGNVELAHLVILPSWRSGIMFKASEQPKWFENFRFVNVDIRGGWDFQSKSGIPTKWGVMGHRLSGFAWIGGAIRDIRDEHAMYMHNLGPAPFLVEDAALERCGRTAIQVVGRTNENGGSPSLAPVRIRGVNARSCGLADGGHAFTFSGCINSIVLERATYRHGFDSATKDYKGTGALVVWPEYGNTPGVGEPNGQVAIVGCDFEMAKGFGKSPLARISACSNLIVGTTRFVSGWNPIAVDISPPDGGMAGSLFPVQQVHALEGNIVSGDVYVNGIKFALGKVAA